VVGDGEVRLARGFPERKPDTTIVTHAATLAGIIEGRRPGIDAFLAGDLRVRGNLALSLRLDDLIQPPDRPVHFPRARHVDAGGIDTFLLEAGEGPPVILLHGLGATNASMLPTLVELAKDHRVIAPDLPGFGDSAKPIRRYHAPFYARWLMTLLDELGIERTRLIGNSMGGRVALELGLRAPERVESMVLLAPSSAFIKGRQFVRVVRMLPAELALVPTPIPHKRVVRFVKSLFARPERLPDPWYNAAADEFLRVFRGRHGRIGFFSAARQIYLEEPYGERGFWHRLPRLEPPALFLWGERDWLVPAKFARHVERAVPAARSMILEDCGHVPQFELPDVVHPLAREFFEGAAERATAI
jgi:pimeloyl-ACP methyl ester carboxylesterase